jgi:hypothetical protein
MPYLGKAVLAPIPNCRLFLQQYEVAPECQPCIVAARESGSKAACSALREIHTSWRAMPPILETVFPGNTTAGFRHGRHVVSEAAESTNLDEN